tara:strand:- start:29 stop:379 length:351 start_codon:yes stop_codon:yes gene_type:complete
MKVDNRSTTSNKSIINKLTHEGVVSNDLLVLINNLTLEDLIALKLELSCAHVNNRLYGLDIWHNACYIIREALLKFAISTTQSKKDAARFLGLTYLEYKTQHDKFNIDSFFKEQEE